MLVTEWFNAPGWTGAPHWQLLLTATLAALLLTSEILSLTTKRTKARGVVQLLANAIVAKWGPSIPLIGGVVSLFANVDELVRQAAGAAAPPTTGEAQPNDGGPPSRS
jgi:hypothetical protein